MFDTDSMRLVRDGVEFRKSSYSETGNCVMFAEVDGGVALCDSKVPNGPVLWFTAKEWSAFLMGIKAGEFKAS